MEIRPIRTKTDYEAVLRRIDVLWGASVGSRQGDELEVLITLVEAYEREQYPVDQPDPIEAVRFRLEQTGKDFRALIGVIGQRTRVYEVMRGARPLSLNMIRNLHRKLKIPAEVLIQPVRKAPQRASHRAGVRGEATRKRAALGEAMPNLRGVRRRKTRQN